MVFSNPFLPSQMLSAFIVSCSKEFKKFTNNCVKQCYLNYFKPILYYFKWLSPSLSIVRFCSKLVFDSIHLSHILTLPVSSTDLYRAATTFTFSITFHCTISNSTTSFRCKEKKNYSNWGCESSKVFYRKVCFFLNSFHNDAQFFFLFFASFQGQNQCF